MYTIPLPSKLDIKIKVIIFKAKDHLQLAT
jgi:hypothetical protein